MKPLMTLKDAAEILNVSAWTVKRLILDNELRGLKVGGQYRLREQDVAAYIDHMASVTIPAWQAFPSTKAATAYDGTSGGDGVRKADSQPKKRRGATTTRLSRQAETYDEFRASP